MPFHSMIRVISMAFFEAIFCMIDLSAFLYEGNICANYPIWETLNKKVKISAKHCYTPLVMLGLFSIGIYLFTHGLPPEFLQCSPDRPVRTR